MYVGLLACRGGGGGGGIRLEDIQAGKGVGIVRSFVSDYNAVETSYQITCLVLLISESQGEMYSHFVAKALWRLVPEVF